MVKTKLYFKIAFTMNNLLCDYQEKVGMQFLNSKF